MELKSKLLIKNRFKTHWQVDAAPDTSTSCCPFCNKTHLYLKDKKEKRIVDIPSEGMPVFIILQLHLFKCRGCNKIFTQPCSDIEPGHRITKRAIAMIIEKSKNQTNVSIAKEFGVTEGTIRLILKNH